MDYTIKIRKRTKLNGKPLVNYCKTDKVTFIDICKQENPDYDFLVLMHALIKNYLINRKGITTEAIEKFHELFAADISSGKRNEDDEPGEDRRSPYRSEHLLAASIEKHLAMIMNVKWQKYNKELII